MVRDRQVTFRCTFAWQICILRNYLFLPGYTKNLGPDHNERWILPNFYSRKLHALSKLKSLFGLVIPLTNPFASLRFLSNFTLIYYQYYNRSHELDLNWHVTSFHHILPSKETSSFSSTEETVLSSFLSPLLSQTQVHVKSPCVLKHSSTDRRLQPVSCCQFNSFP